MIKISIIGTVGVPACYGGFETLVENLLDNVPESVRYTVFCSGAAYPSRMRKYKNAQLKYLPLEANGLSSIFYDGLSMLQSLKSDVMLILGVSGCFWLPIIRLLYRGKIITNIDGLEWKRAKWNVQASQFLRFSEKMAVLFSDIVIGDNQGITDYVSSRYQKKAELIEYGADHVLSSENKNYYNDYPFCSSRYMVTVCRIEPENNIAEILTGHISSNSSVLLVIVGNWQKSEYGRRLFSKFSQQQYLLLLDPIYDSDRINFIRRNASAYIHGHSAGGTNPSLVEAMCLGLPVYAFDCAYNRFTTENKARYWGTPDELGKILTSDTNDIENALQMKEIADRRYQWKRIAKKYVSLF